MERREGWRICARLGRKKGKGRGFGQKESCRGEDLVMSGHEQVVIPAPALGYIQEATHCQVCQRPWWGWQHGLQKPASEQQQWGRCGHWIGMFSLSLFSFCLWPFFSCCQLTHSLSSCPWCPEEEFCLCGDVVLFGQKERYCCFPWIFQSRVMGGNRCYQLQQRKEEAVDLRFPLPNSWWWIHMSKTTLAHFCSLLPTSGAVEVGWTLFCFPSLVVLILPYNRNLLSFAGDVWHG